MVTLVREVDGSPTEFEVGHAERILSLSRSGWALPKESDYVLKDGSLIRRGKKGDKGAEKA
jgi:hypothetical protein